MFGRRRWRAPAVWSLLQLSSACFSTTAPDGWLSTPAVAQREAYGGWIAVERAQDTSKQTVEGELIAVTPDSLYVLTPDSLLSLPMGEITSATLTTYDARLGRLATWTALGAISTISHGVGLVLTFPLWTIAGSTLTASASKAPRVQSADATSLQPYARFPQGLPLGLDRRALRQKHVPAP